MDFEWIAVALGDIAWLAVAFVLGLASRAVGLPPLVGFLAAGFVLNLFGIASGEMLRKLADLGITLLFFIVGLKLNLRTLARPQVWAVTGLHMALAVLVLGTVVLVLVLLNVPSFSGNGIYPSLLIAFALSFSSTVFVVKVLEDKGETAALHGRIAVGILIVQDLAAVAFIAVSAGMWPSPGRSRFCSSYRRGRCCFSYCRKSAMASSSSFADCSSPWAARKPSSWSA